MNSMVHELKTWDWLMMDIATGKKSFEVRKNDRNYEVGDGLILRGYKRSGLYAVREMTDIMVGFIIARICTSALIA